MLTKLLSCLPWRRAVIAIRTRTAPPEREDTSGCGWFDSSHDLHHGLRVQEHTGPDTLVQELPLAAWLELQVSGWRVTHPA